MSLGNIFDFRRPGNFDTGMNYIASGQPKKAIKEFDKLILKNPDDYESIHMKGECLADIGQLEQALECFNESLRLNEGNVFSMLNKGGTLEALNNYEEALDVYKRLIKQNWGNKSLQEKIHDAFYRRGMILMKRKKLDAALKEYENALSINPRNDLALANVGSIYLEKVLNGAEDYQTLQTEAGRFFFEALRLNPNNVTANYSMGYMMHGLSKPQEAITYLEKVPEDNSMYSQAQLLKEDCVKQLQLES